MEIKEKKTQSGVTWRFVNEYEDTRTGFNHKTTIFRGAYEYGSYKVHYINRTWEMYSYQTSMRSGIRTIYDEGLNKYISNYKYVHNINRFKKGEKEKVVEEYKLTDEAKELEELLDCIEKREFDGTTF